MSRLVAGIVLILAATAAPAASPDPKSLEIPAGKLTAARELVRQLGNDSFRDRDTASRKLSEMGREALPALLEAVRETLDSEVRMRCEFLLPKAESEDMRAKVEVFLADTDGKYEHDLPGWAKFKEITGNDKSARELFAEMIKVRDNHELLIATRYPGVDLQKVVDSRKRQIQYRMQPAVYTPNFRPQMPTLHEGAAIILAEVIAPEREDGWQGGWIYHTQNFFYQIPDFQQAARGQGKYGAALKKLAEKWIETRDGSQGLNVAVNIAQNLNLGQAVINKIYIKMLYVEGQNAQWQRQQALQYIARTNAKEHVRGITKLFDDSTLLMQAVKQPNFSQPEVLVRDYALVVALQLTGQKPTDYGMKVTENRRGYVQDMGKYHFPEDKDGKTDTARDAAFAKWKDWAEKNLPAEKKDDKPKSESPKK